MTTTVAPLTSDDIEAFVIVETILSLRADRMRASVADSQRNGNYGVAEAERVAVAAFEEALRIIEAARTGDNETLEKAAHDDNDYCVSSDETLPDVMLRTVTGCLLLRAMGLPDEKIKDLVQHTIDEDNKARGAYRVSRPPLQTNTVPAHMNRQQRRAAARKNGR